MEKSPIERLELDRIQRKIIDKYIDRVSQEIDLSKTIFKGFLWKLIRKWQKIHGVTLLETEKGSGNSF